MDFEVFRQVIAAGKLLLTDDALVRFYSRVGAPMSGQLIGPGKPPSTAGPRAGEGFLPCVPPQMGLEVAALGVHLIAAGKRALVHFNKVCD